MGVYIALQLHIWIEGGKEREGKAEDTTPPFAFTLTFKIQVYVNTYRGQA